MQALTTARALPTGTRIGRLGRVSQIVRLRPRRRDDEREADLRRAFDWEGVEQPVVCSALVPHSTSASSSEAAFATANAALGAVVGTMAVAPSAVMSAMAVAPVQNATSTQDACAAFEPAFRCAPCRAGAPCPAAVDLFPSPWRRGEHLHAGAFPFPSSDASSRSSLLTARPTRRRRLDSPRARHGAGSCVACCIARSCATAGCAALAGVVPTDAAGNIFTARPRSPSVLQRTGRAAGCSRVRAALCAAASPPHAHTRSSHTKHTRRAGRSEAAGQPAGQAPPRAPSTAPSTNPTVADDIRLLRTACAQHDALRHDDAARNASVHAVEDGAQDDAWFDEIVRRTGGPRLGEGAPPAMRPDQFFTHPGDRHGWTAYFVLQMHEDVLIRRLLREVRGIRHGERARWLEALCDANF